METGHPGKHFREGRERAILNYRAQLANTALLYVSQKCINPEASKVVSLTSGGSNASPGRALHTGAKLRFGGVWGSGLAEEVAFAGRSNGFPALRERSGGHRLARVILCAVMKPDERSPACR